MKKLSVGFLLLGLSLLAMQLTVRGADSDTVDLVVFSFNRPLQLYAFLESTQNYVSGLQEQHVIFRASSDQFKKGYDVVRAAFPDVNFHEQGDNPRADFKPLTLKASFESPAQYVVYAVDDIVVKEIINLSECARALEEHDAYGFYLRLGKNLTQCYPYGGRAQPHPPFELKADAVYSWIFRQGAMDWAYPNTVDMTVYRKKDIKNDLAAMAYAAPNTLEDAWCRRSRGIMHKKGLCYASSKIVNLPLNRVQNEYNNRAMSEYSPQDLLSLFDEGKKMDIALLASIDNKAAHMEYSPQFVQR